MENEYERVRALFPSAVPCGVWVPLQNGFEGLATSRGAYRLRRPITLAGRRKWEVFTLTRKGGLRFAFMCDA